MSNPAALGLKFREARPFALVPSPAVAGSTHYVLVPGVYELWATIDVLVFLTNAGTDPPAIPTGAQPTDNYPGCFVPATAILDFAIDATDTASIGGNVPIGVTGIRVVQLGTDAGMAYVSQFRQERP